MGTTVSQKSHSRSLATPEKSLSAWLDYLKDCSPPVFPRQSSAANQSLPNKLLRHRITLSPNPRNDYEAATVIRAAWSLVNASYSDCEDVVFGFALVTQSNKQATELRRNALPARFALNSAQPISELLRDIEADLLPLSPSEDIVLEDIATMGADTRNASMFRNQLILYTDTMDSPPIDLDRPLNIECNLLGRTLILQALFDPLAIDSKQMRRTFRKFEYIVDQLYHVPAETLVQDLMSPSTYDIQEIKHWNEMLPESANERMQDLVGRSVQKSPEAPAICSIFGNFTYAQVDYLTDSLAKHLASMSVGPGSIVAMAFEKCPWAVFGMLAILKAGGAFVPLDPAYSWSSIAQILESSGAKLVLCSSTHSERFAEQGFSHLVVEETFLKSLPASDPFDGASHPEDPGYVIFTSGSTGVPKGIVCSHKAWCTNTLAHGAAELITSQSRCLQFSAYTFDISISDIFTTLAFGGCICIPSESERMNDLAGAMTRMKVNQAALTPTVAQFLRPEAVPDLEVLKIGGEAMTPQFVQLWADKVRLMNSYGPAECTSRSSCGWVTRNADPAVIGRAIGGALWVTEISNHQRLAPIGAVGELIVEGHILADGYLNDEKKTQASFINSPTWLTSAFPERAGRVYCTGDLVQYTSDGQLRFMGRKDTQIKIRGVRLEPGHVEAKIRQRLPSGGQVVVDKMIFDEQTRQPMLVAFLQIPGFESLGRDQAERLVPVSEEIRAIVTNLERFLAQDLPSYMVPNCFVPVTRIPIGATGKTNQKALRAIALSVSRERLNKYAAAEHNRTAHSPMTRMQSLLRSLWAAQLQVEESSISLQDTFFRLGGDSLLAMKVVSAAHDSGLALTVSEIFQFPRLADLADNLEISGNCGTSIPIVEPFALVGGASQYRAIRQQLYVQYRILGHRVEDVYPCAPIQEALMAETMAHPQAYILQEVLSVSVDMDNDMLKSAWEKIVQENPILRTRIVTLPKLGCLQVVMEEAEPVTWHYGQNLSQYLQRDKATPMSYGDNLNRLAIIRSLNGAIFVVWTTHHAITDGWMHEEVLQQVERLCLGQSSLAMTPYNHFIKYLQESEMSYQETYWQSELSNLDVMNFPDWPSTYEPVISDWIEHPISLQPGVKDFTTSIILRAAWALILAQYSGSTDIVLGITESGRNIPVAGIDHCLGPTLVTVPVRIGIDYSDSCFHYLEMLQKQYIMMIPHQHAGLQHMKKFSKDCSNSCNFHSLLVVQPEPRESEIFRRHELRDAGDQLSYGLLLEFQLGVKGITLKAGFDPNVISSAMVERMIHQIEYVAQQLAKEGNERVLLSQIDVLGRNDRETLAKWNPEIEESTQCMHWMVEKQVFAQPQAPAVEAWDGNFTYRQLDDHANRLATCLRNLGVGVETIVPFCFEKSAWSVVALFAILKAGGVCVALDTSHPRSRHQKIISDAEAKVIVASDKQAKFMDFDTQVISVGPESMKALPKGSRMEANPVSPRNAAFVVYSSGSTGTPKGSVLDHASLCTTSRTNSMHLHFGASTRVVQFAAYAFDVAIEENIITLMYGGCVCIPSDEERLDDLAGAMRRMRVNWADLTPTVARTLSPATVPCLKTLVMGGEALSQDIIDTWAGSVNLINTYGPSECSIQCTASKSLQSFAAGANIGSAVNCNLWVVAAENHDRLMPIGCVGELLIEGPIVGRGYLKEGEKTKASFIEGPSWVSSEKNEKTPRRFYKTGDLAKYNEDGTLDCLGRKDTQIKLYGQRIELGEIEHSLKKTLKTVENNVVVEAFHPCSSPERKLLAAFIHVAKPGSASVLDMSDRLRAEFLDMKKEVGHMLPEYMIPSLYVPMSSLPTNVSGKIDRKNLRQIAESFDRRQTSLYSLFEFATKDTTCSDEERALQKLWADVLHIDLNSDPVGSDDNFLQLGGDSIAAMHLVGRARQNGLALSVSSIFRNPKLCDMALIARRTSNRVIGSKGYEKGNFQPTEPPTEQRKASFPFQAVSEKLSRKSILQSLEDTYLIEQGDVLDIYPCTPMQEGLMALTTENLTAYVLQDVFELPSGIDVPLFKAAWASVARGNEILRTRIVFVEGLGSCQAVMDERIQWQQAESLEDYLSRDRAQAMAYGQRLTRYAIINDGARNYFVWSVHHALYDGHSYGLTLEAVQNSYDADDQTLHYSPFSSFVQYLSKVDPISSETYWRNQFEGLETSPFPQAIPGHRPKIDNFLHHKVVIAKSPDTGVTVSAILRTAWALVLSGYSDCQDVVFGVTLSGRDISLHDVDKVMGPTITTMPVRICIDPEADIQSFVHLVQDQYVEMIQHSHTGLQRIKPLSTSAQAACDFQNLLVVQPASPKTEENSVFAKPVDTTNLRFLAGYGLVVECELQEGCIAIRAHHDSNMISSPQIRRLLHQFDHVINQLGQGKGKVDDVELFSAADKAEISRFNAGYPEVVNDCIHQIIRQQVKKQPSATAIASSRGSISYAELESFTNHLAHDLQDAGVGPESLVPVCCEKSTAAILAMISIQKAGGAFVPLNPSDPPDRLQYLVRTTDPCILLFSEQTKHLATEIAPKRRSMILDIDTNHWATSNDTPVHSSVRASNTAYALFTSGSTGRPKAVVITHQAVSSSTAGHGEAMGFRLYPRRVLQFASYTFDACIAEIYTTLTHGGCVCVPSEHERMNSLVHFMNDFRVDWTFFTPSFVATIRPEDVPTLKTLVLGGEALSQNNVDVWAEKVLLMNGYGPTETCVFCVTRNIPGPQKGATHRPETIGHAVSSLSWIVDPKRPEKLAPVGCIGELLVQGPSLARGYLNDPEKTAAAFIESPGWLREFGYTKPQVMYKTGDLVRYNPDGSLMYLGRKDNQVKVNGQRLELGEIENQIKSKLGKLGQAIAIVGKPKNLDSKQTLAVFLQVENMRDQTEEQLIPMSDVLRARLVNLESEVKRELTSYMVPSLWIPLTLLPTQVSGKTDRKTLVALLNGLSAEQLMSYTLAKPSDGIFRAPTTNMERAIHQHLVRVLAKESIKIGINESFFKLGGDSITAIQLVASLRGDGISLTTEDIFRQPSLADLAKVAKTSELPTSAEQNIAPYSLLREGLRDEIVRGIACDYGIEQTAIEDILPPTPLQEGLLALTIKDPEAYVLRDVFRLPFDLNIDRLQRAWDVVVRDSPILRTTIVNLESSGCWQVVLRNNIMWTSSCNVDECVANDKLRPFGYGMPLMRLALVDDKWNGRYFVWTIHHSLYDGWSYRLILNKVQEVYKNDSIATGQSFNRFIKYLSASDSDEAKAFWRSQFSGLEAIHFPRLPSPTFEPLVDTHASVNIRLTRKMNTEFTVATILKAAWALVIGRYIGAKEATFGVTQTGRNAPLSGITDMVGPTITTVPLRIKIDSTRPVASLLDSIQKQSTDMIRFEHTGLQYIRRINQECREACEFGSILLIQPGDQSDVEFLGSERVADKDKGFWRFRLGIECTVKEDSIQVTAGSDSRLLCKTQTQRMLYQFKSIVEQLNLETTRPVDSLKLMSPEDEERLLDWNRVVPEAVNECAHEVILRTVQKTPDALAVDAWDVDLRYWELDSFSTKLAHHLQSMGVGPETIVPLCFEKSGWSVVALLAVIKAGGAFVFLDPNFPRSRLQEIIRQVQAKFILTSLAQAGLWNSELQVQVVDEVFLELLPSFANIPESGVTPANALYVIFTSGSTGTPKGCVVQHSNFLTGAQAQAKRASMTAQSRVLQVASYSFDVSILEMVTAMTVGACICVPNERAKSRSIAAVINDMRITWSFLTPSVVKLMKPSDVPNLKTLILGGEALTTHNVETWAEHVQLANGYGPSECSIAAAGNPNLKPTTDPANIGKAVGAVCWITEPDDHNRLAPLGTIGEILIEGPIVARGYLNNPEKTAEVFIEDPTWASKQNGQPPRRMYKTGDLAYFNEDGSIIFVGRKDSQVKVRGQRMELGEIETHISVSAQVQHAMVVYPSHGLCKQKLVAVLSLKSLGTPADKSDAIEVVDSKLAESSNMSISEIEAHLSSVVPSYMVPNLWVVVKGFPLMPSGKLNRKAIDKWIGNMDESTYRRACGLSDQSSLDKPSTAMEEQLQKIWSEVLRLPAQDIGVKQAFTSLGGDSILAMQMISRCRRQGIGITLNDIVTFRTISQLALCSRSYDGATTVVAEKENELFELTPIQKFYADTALQDDCLSRETNRRFNHTFCLRVRRSIQATELARALETIVRRHSMLRARFKRDPTTQNEWMQLISDNVADSFRFRAWNNVTLDQVKPGIEEARTGLDVEQGPLLAADLVSVNGHEQYFFVVAHHLVVDMVSWTVVMQDLEELLTMGEPTNRTPFSFFSWARMQRKHAAENLKPEACLPIDIPPANFKYWDMEGRANVVRDVVDQNIRISATDTAALLQTCKQYYDAEPMDILVSTLSHAFSFVFTDRSPPAIFRYGHGREPFTESIDLTRTVGWFSTFTPVHVATLGREDSITVLRRAVATRQKIPRNGWDYFASRYQHADGPRKFAGHEQMEVTINYLGGNAYGMRHDEGYLFELPPNMEGGLGAAGQDVKCFSLFSVTAAVEQGCLELKCCWNGRSSHQKGIARWFRVFERLLRDVADRAVPKAVRKSQGLSRGESAVMNSGRGRRPRRCVR